MSSDRLEDVLGSSEEQNLYQPLPSAQRGLRPLGPWWDGFIACVLMDVALAVPVEVSFLEVSTFSGNWWLSRTLDLVRVMQTTKEVVYRHTHSGKQAVIGC